MRRGACSKSATTCTRCSTTSRGSTAATPTASRSSSRSTIPTAASSPCSSTAPTPSPTRSCGAGCAPSICPALLPGTDADLVAAFTPIALEVDAPGDVPRETARDNRTVLLWFLNTPPEVAWEPVIVEHRRRLEEAGQGTVVAALPFIPTIAGTDTYTDKLWARLTAGRSIGPSLSAQSRARISTWVTTKTASSDVRPAREGVGDRLQLVGIAQAVLEGLLGEARVAHPVGPQPAPPGPGLGVGVGPRRARHLDVGEPGCVGQAEQPGADPGVVAVAGRDRESTARASGRARGPPGAQVKAP